MLIWRWCGAQEGEDIGMPMWPNLEGEGLGDEEAMPAMPRWLNVNLPRMNGAPHGGPGVPGFGRIPGGIGRIGDGLGGRHAVEVPAHDSRHAIEASCTLIDHCHVS